MIQEWSFPTKIFFGAGSIEKLQESLATLGVKNPLLVADPGLPDHLLAQTKIETVPFRALSSNPTHDDLILALDSFRGGKHDGVVAMGGGSAMDIAKLLAFMVKQTRPVWDFEDVGDNYLRATCGLAPIIAIPTTAGTGSEVGRAAVLTCARRKIKKIIFHPEMLPKVAILDPVLTVTLPSHLTAATGMDALAHCLEAYCAPGFHPMANGIAIEGMSLLKEALPQAVKNGKDLEARGKMQVAAMMGATAFQKGLGAIHSLSHPVGACFNLHHGLLNAVFMPYVLQYNRGAIEEKLAHAAACLELKSHTFDAFFDWTIRLRKELKIPHTLAELGDFSLAPHLDSLSKAAFADPSTGGNPIPLKVEDMRALLEQAYEGTL